MNFSNMRIGVRLGFGFASVLVLLVLLTGTGLWCQQRSESITDHMVEHILEKERLMTEWRYSTHINGVRTIAVIHNADPAEQKRMEPQIKATSQRISEIQKKLESMSKDAAEMELYADIEKKRASYLAARESVFNQKKAGNEEEAKRLATMQLEPALADYVDSIQKLTRYISAGIVTATGNIESNYRTAEKVLMVLGMLALLVGAGFAWGIARSITQPLAQAVRIAQTVAAGDLTSRIDLTTRDEAGQLLQALKHMNESLIRIVSEVRGSTETITAASGQIAGGNLDLSSRTEQQASSLEETASSMEEIMGTVKQNADNARQANQLATDASAVASKGGRSGVAGGGNHGVDPCIGEEDRRHHWRHRRYRIPDQYPGIECCSGGGEGWGTGARLRGGGIGGAQSGTTLGGSGKGDQGADRRFGGKSRQRCALGRRGRQDNGRDRRKHPACHGYRRRNQPCQPGAEFGHRADQCGDHADGQCYAAERHFGGGGCCSLKLAARAGRKIGSGCQCVQDRQDAAAGNWAVGGGAFGADCKDILAFRQCYSIRKESGEYQSRCR